MKTRVFSALCLLLTLLLASRVYSGVIIVFPLGDTVSEEEPPIVLYEAQAPASLGANGTSMSISVVASESSYDAVPYGSFDEGFDGWRYSASDYGVFAAYWIDEGYIVLRGYSGTPYTGWIAVLVNLSFTCYDDIAGLRLSFDYAYYQSNIFTISMLYVYVYEWDTGSTYDLYARILAPTGWSSVWRDVSSSFTPSPDANYSIVFQMYVLAGQGEADLYLDNVSLAVYTDGYGVRNIEILNATCIQGSYNVSMRVDGVAGGGSALIALSGGSEASSPIVVEDGAVVSGQTGWISLDSSVPLDRSLLAVLDACLDPGETLEISATLVYAVGGVRVEYPVLISIHAP